MKYFFVLVFNNLKGIVYSIYYFIKFKKKIKIYYYNNVWIHKKNNKYFADIKINFHLDFEKSYKNFEYEWLYIFKPEPNDIIIDIGAGIGSEVYHFSNLIKNGKIYAIEAHPSTFNCLASLVKLNRLNNVIPLHYAISDSNQDVYIDSPNNLISASIITRQGKIKVKSITLDELIKNYDIKYISYIKMNIEGAEKLAIRGMNRALKITKYLCISCHDFKANKGEGEFFRTKEIVRQFLEKNNFKIIEREDKLRPWIQDQINAINLNILRD